MTNEKLAKLLKTAFSLTLLMAVFSTGMTAVTLANSSADISIWKPIGQALLIMGPIVVIEWYAYRHFKKKADADAAEAERLEKARLKAERKARAEANRAKHPKKKKK